MNVFVLRHICVRVFVYKILFVYLYIWYVSKSNYMRLLSLAYF